MKIEKFNIGLQLLFVILNFNLKAQVLETEDSKPLLPGQFYLGTGLEFQTSSEGTETALPLAIEYGLSQRFTLLVEPVVFTNINPNEGKGATGFGDVEVTLFYQMVREKEVTPSLSVSAEVKIPATNNPMIGTGKADFTPYLIASKTLGKFFTSINFSYTFLGKPEGVQANNLINYGLGTIYSANGKNIFFAEIYGNTSAFGGNEIDETTSGDQNNSQNQEISGGETVGSVGYGSYIGKELLLSFGISYDNNQAVLFRPGIEWKFGSNKQ